MEKLDMSLDDIVKTTKRPSRRRTASSSNSYGKTTNRRSQSSRTRPYDRNSSRNGNPIRRNGNNSNNFEQQLGQMMNMNPSLMYMLLAAANNMNMNMGGMSPLNMNNPGSSNSGNSRNSRSLNVSTRRDTQGFEVDGAGEAVLKVSARSNPKNVAGSICHAIRNGGKPSLLATGVQCVNIAVKALCIGRDYLSAEKLDFTVAPQVRDKNKGSVTFQITRSRIDRRDFLETKAIKVAASSKPHIVAGAIAVGIREGELVSMTFIGPDCVNVAVQSVDMARLYLQDDSFDLSFKPTFVHLMQGGQKLSGIQFYLQSHDI